MSATAVTVLGDDWRARMDESSRRIERSAARATHHHAADIGASELNFETRPVPRRCYYAPARSGYAGTETGLANNS
jgi:hypothetical protein